MKRLEIRAAIAALLVGTMAAAQGGQPPAPPTQSPPPSAGVPGGPRGMPASERARTFESKSLGAPVSYVAYLPQDYETSKASYPVIYALHGMFENSAFWERRGLALLYEELLKTGVAPNAIVVTVDGGNNLFVNSGKGKYQDLVTRDLVEHIDKTYRTVARRDGRALLGISMGGYGALNIAFSQPAVFGAVATHSAMLLTQIPTVEAGARGGQMRAFTGVFGEPVDPAIWKADDPLELARTVDASRVGAVYFDCGGQDRYGLFAGNEALHTILEGRRIAHDFSISQGDHGYDFVKSVLARSLGFLKGKLATR